ncbi:unnamed protein product [Rotaria sp. Silwood1]|nr:unnamed protein product [Rotaria sp. Silwood1]
MSFGTNWWIIKSKKNTGVENEEHKISVFENGFYIDKSELEKLDSEELKRFLRSLKEDQLPDAMLKSPYYPGDHVNYYFTIKEKEMGTSLAWRNYESEEVELNKYDPEWSNLYKTEYENILSHLPINENCCEHDQLLMLEMEHIGSTSVEGMYAKPIIDMLIIQGPMRDGGRSHQVRILYGYQWQIILYLIFNILSLCRASTGALIKKINDLCFSLPTQRLISNEINLNDDETTPDTIYIKSLLSCSNNQPYLIALIDSISIYFDTIQNHIELTCQFSTGDTRDLLRFIIFISEFIYINLFQKKIIS